MHQIRFRLGLRPTPRWGSLQRSPRPLAGFKGPTSKGKGGNGRGGVGIGGERIRREEEEGREERGRGGIRTPLRIGLVTGLCFKPLTSGDPLVTIQYFTRIEKPLRCSP